MGLLKCSSFCYVHTISQNLLSCCIFYTRILTLSFQGLHHGNLLGREVMRMQVCPYSRIRFGTVSDPRLQTAIVLLCVAYSNLILCVFKLKLTVGKSGVRAPSTRVPAISEFFYFLIFGD